MLQFPKSCVKWICRFSLLPSLFFFYGSICAQSFHILPLGVLGGLNEANLSSYLVKGAGDSNYIALDAGTLYAGIEAAMGKKTIPASDPTVFFRRRIAAYFISHPHLDHVAGLVMNAPADTNKTVYALPFCNNAMLQHYFSWDTWANFTDSGALPQLHKYHLSALSPGKEIPVPGSALSVTAYPLSHAAPHESTAFLVRQGEDYLLYFGDTGADKIEHSDRMRKVWQTIVPLVRNRKLKGILLEVSFPNSQPDNLLFGHLTPHWLNRELAVLDSLCGHHALKNLPLIVTHIKPEANSIQEIKKELYAENPFGLKWLFPVQGLPIEL